MTLSGILKSTLLIAVLFIGWLPVPSRAFGLLAHEAIIDALWEKSIKPLLKQKYPGATEEQLKKAHAFVYGGSIIPDIGYYPLGSPEFSSLLHYVRSGDFVTALLDESRNLNEYGFALGVLCHYEADRYGHSLATNKAVAILFSKLKKKYGNDVTFEQGRDQHARVEFGFDVLQVAKGNYQSEAYHDFIGFEISDSVLERAFVNTYGIKLDKIFKSFPAAVSLFRFSVRVIIPELTEDAWRIKNSFITQLNPLATEKTFHYKMDRRKYQKEFPHPKVQSFFISLVIAVLPKYGPLSRFKPKMPSPECETLFEHSFDEILVHYAATMQRLGNKGMAYANIDLDTGLKTDQEEYRLTYKAYYKLLMNLQHSKFASVDEALKRDFTAYYSKHESHGYAANSHKGKKIRLALVALHDLHPAVVVGKAL